MVGYWVFELRIVLNQDLSIRHSDHKWPRSCAFMKQRNPQQKSLRVQFSCLLYTPGFEQSCDRKRNNPMRSYFPPPHSLPPTKRGAKQISPAFRRRRSSKVKVEEGRRERRWVGRKITENLWDKAEETEVFVFCGRGDKKQRKLSWRRATVQKVWVLLTACQFCCQMELCFCLLLEIKLPALYDEFFHLFFPSLVVLRGDSPIISFIGRIDLLASTLQSNRYSLDLISVGPIFIQR